MIKSFSNGQTNNQRKKRKEWGLNESMDEWRKEKKGKKGKKEKKEWINKWINEWLNEWYMSKKRETLKLRNTLNEWRKNWQIHIMETFNISDEDINI